MGKPKDDITKKALYYFKKFARENNFWEHYKKLSDPINMEGKTFIDVLNENEPIKIIQNACAFCHWPPPSPFQSHPNWGTLSMRWAKICCENDIMRDKIIALNYLKQHISTSLYHEFKSGKFS